LKRRREKDALGCEIFVSPHSWEESRELGALRGRQFLAKKIFADYLSEGVSMLSAPLTE
jgi:hypothetical protein|tara:strand:- start:406 stop:582 length:177 start_codon:yes stop_codon:yes gene_type:complete